MQVKFDKSILKVVDKIKQQVDKQTQEALNRVVEYATTNAQNAFDRFVFEVPADDPFVFVVNTPMVQLGKRTWSRTITCVGNQVLFIEFGAGVYYYTGSTETRLYQKYLGGLPDRPSSIDEIGHYHLTRYPQSRGKDDTWFYKSQTGRESENAHLIKFNKNGEPIMKTHGNRPARALYRGVGLAVRKLAGGRLK